MQRLEAADRFFAATGADIRHGGTRAYYAEGPDYVQMPPFETFRDAEGHAAVLGHELTHWTKHSKRLARDLGRKRFGAKARRGGACRGARFSVSLCRSRSDAGSPRGSRRLYCEWITVLKDDKRAIFNAAAHAQRAADYLHSLQPQQTGEERAAA
jgi:antirestriction protein ArdC